MGAAVPTAAGQSGYGRAAGWMLVVLALALGGALVAAAVGAALAIRGQEYWAAGYRRLIADAFVERFDECGAAAAGILLALAGATALVLRRRGRAASPPGARTLRTALVVLAVVALVRGAIAIDAWRTADGPNLVLISIDTLRADRLGAYGYDLPTSPALDRHLAGEGVTFENVLSQSPKTTPSHMTMLTSLYPCEHGIELWPDESVPASVLSPRVHTLAEVLKNAGYATVAFTGGGHMHRSRGFDQGFDVFKHRFQLERTLEWLAGRPHRKFFLFFHTYEVHDPYLHPMEYVRRFAPDYQGPVLQAVERLLARPIESPDRGAKFFWKSVDRQSPDDVRFVSHLYDAGIRHMDDTTLTPVLDTLDQLGLTRDTLVVFTSDHGEAFNEHGAFLHDDLYAGTLHVPLVLRFPGRLPAGARVAQPARLLDVMPTILQLLGVPIPHGVRGRSLVALARGVAVGEHEQALVSEYNLDPKRVFESLRRDRLTYIVDGGTERLFDDPAERDDRAAVRPADLEAMRAELNRWRAECRSGATVFGPKGGRVTPDDETVRQLRALGYVQ
jgi:arylsulfatase A-like enzyme